MTAPNPLTVHCRDCRLIWAACFLPLEAARVARILRNLRCPACNADTDRIAMGEPPEQAS